jgi:two-component system, NarL family, sensor histidine kinase DevS
MSRPPEPSPADGASIDRLPGTSQALLDAVMAISSDLDLRSVLTRIVEAATSLTGARYGALGVIGSDDWLVEFVTTGLTGDERTRIGELPHGRGILGLLISDPRPIRLRDLADHPASYGFPPNHPPMAAFLGVPVRIRGTVFGNLYLTEKDGGGEFTGTDERLAVALASAAGLVIENARTYGRSERQRQWLEAAAELTNALQPPVETDVALQQITLTTRRVARARAVAIVSLDGDGSVRALAAEPGDLARMTGAVESLLARLDRTVLGEPVDVDLGVDGLLATVVPLRALLAERGPLVAVFDPADHRLRDVDDRELLISFADHAALALDRAQAVGERAQLAVISDRERIARDLHDVVIQRLFAIGMQLQAASLRGPTDEVRERLEQAVHDLDATIRDVRATIFELQTQGAGSLRQELRALVRDYVPVLGFSPVVRTTGPVDTAVTGPIRDQVLPVLREALSNVARHAHATQAEVELAVADDEACLVVRDDGVGMHPDAAHSGLHNARRRATALGGTLELLGRDPHGSVLRWRVPLAQAAPQA